MIKFKVQPGTTIADPKYKITVVANGPYLVFGRPPLKQQFIMPNSDGVVWFFKAGEQYSTQTEPTALCRCGESKLKPYCDGSHLKADWNPTLTASTEPLLDGAEVVKGKNITLTDNRSYCAFARFCDANGQIWNLIEDGSKAAEELAIREANHCAAGRLSVWKNTTKEPIEPHFDPSLGLIEDQTAGCSAGLWVRGGIPIIKDDGTVYEVRNRVTLCRCGQSSNKPFCDGTHASMAFDDDLPKKPKPRGEEF